MSQSTQDIRRRIQGIGSIMQITNAMELVASAKLRKSRQRLEGTKPYFDIVYNNINSILGISNTQSELMIEREVKNRAIIVVASDKGLAGGYNINITNKVLKNIKENEDAVNHVYTTGTRAVETLRRRGVEVNTDFTYIGDEPNMDDAASIGSYFVSKFLNEDFDEVYIVYTKFNSVVSLETEAIKLLPVSGFKKSEKYKKIDFEFEPSPTVVLTQMIKQYVNVCLLYTSDAADEQ